MWIPSSGGCSVNKLFTILQTLLRTQDSDGFLLYWAKEILGALLIVALFWMLAQLVCLMLNKWGKRLTTFTRTDLDDRLLKRVIPHVSRLLTMLGFYLAILSLPLHEKIVMVLSGALYIMLVMIIFNLLYHSSDELLQWYVAGQQDSSGGLISRHMIPIAEKAVMLFLLGTALIIVLKHFNYDIFSLVTALGIGSLAIGMAAKDTLAHMISGFTLMLDRPFYIGDRIRLASGQIGDVIDIGLRSTKIQGIDSTVLIIPNSDLCNSTVVNMVRPTAITQGRITIGVGYGSDVERVKALLLEIAGNNDDVVAEPSPLALFTAFGDSALNMLLLFWIKEPARIGIVADQLNCEIIRRFRQEEIEIPFPIRTVRMEKAE
ncbi:MAG: mechanosensitive ion channel protein MscS [Geobacter sp.]|nr:MAG: mechanosensitive ion channel protein MscS [Geobacter sp.]